MKIGDTIECVETKAQGVIVRSMTSIGGRDDIVKIYFGVEWNSESPAANGWLSPSSLKVVTSYESTV